jgi:leucyl aminopeptidase (aminopeptidase T)
MKTMKAWQAARNALEHVLKAQKGETLIIFCDDERKKICEPFTIGALNMGLKTHLVILKTQPDVFRRRVPLQACQILRKQTPDISINLLRENVEETPFRIEFTRMETEKGKSRIGHCPGITLDMLTNGALALRGADHRKMQQFAHRLVRKLRGTVKLEITNASGTRISLSVKDRPFFTDTIIDPRMTKWMNLPTGEVTVAPVEDSLQGRLICDIAVGGIGPVKKPVEISVKNGKVENAFSADVEILGKIKNSLKTDSAADVVGEFAFGINPKARFVREFLEAEKVCGTVHVAFGDNSDMPCGRNRSKNHMDFLISKPSVTVYKNDKSSFDILQNGAFAEF